MERDGDVTDRCGLSKAPLSKGPIILVPGLDHRENGAIADGAPATHQGTFLRTVIR